ncbi:MAG: DUF1015 domain-containing protein [Bacteroidota bacterium]
MPEVAPFRGLRYNKHKVGLDDVVAPPYDVISPELQDRLYGKNPYNVVRLILGREENRYEAAARTFKQWKNEGILEGESLPAIYLLHQVFDGPDRKPVTRKGFVARCRLEEFDKKIILPHEKTHAKPIEDRLSLFQATQSNFSQIFSLYADPEKEVDRAINGLSKTDPAIDVSYDGVQNKLWPVLDTHAIESVRRFMASRQALIADGHHRYETALAYRDMMRTGNLRHTGKEPYNYVMMFFTNVDDAGLVIYPTHRVVHSLTSFNLKGFLDRAAQYFILREFVQQSALLSALESSSAPSFGMVAEGRQSGVLLSLKPVRLADEIISDLLPREIKELDVTVLHRLVLRDLLGISMEAQDAKRNIDYIRDASEAVGLVRDGKAQLAFLMNATKIQQVRAVAMAGHTMPQKSTYFYPKLLSGLVINSLAEERA